MKLKPHEFTVTRQLQWPDGNNVVEVSQGGIDYTNPDALCKKYAGEFETFIGMRPAVEAAIGIAKAWKLDQPEVEIEIGIGCTHGMTMPFDGESLTDEAIDAMLKRADEFDATLPHCAQCGELIQGDAYGSHEIGEYECCSEYCAEKYYYQPEEETEEE